MRVHLIFGSLFILVGTLMPSIDLLGQSEIPIGTWRAHISYNNIKYVAVADNKIYGATTNGIMMLDRSDNSLTGFTRLEGLSGADISYIAYDQTKDILIIAYEDGNLDILASNTITNFNRLKNSSSINGSKKINHITIRSGYAYLSADYGVVVFDLNALEVKETWRDLGVNGSPLKIEACTFKSDSVFLATEKGVITGDLSTNLLDYNYWKRYDQNIFNTNVQHIATFNDKIYAALDNIGLYRNENGTWIKEPFLQSISFTSLNGSISNLLITENANVWRLTASHDLIQLTDNTIIQPNTTQQDAQGNFWIGDGVNGLVSNASGNFSSAVPNGPKNPSAFRLSYYNNSIYSLPGGFSSSFNSLGNTGGIDVFQDGQWSNITSQAKDITDAAFISKDKFYVSSFGYGVEERNAQNSVTLFDDSNSSLANTNPPGKFVNITALKNSSDGLWVANYGTSNSLHLLQADATWSSYSFPQNAARYPLDMCIDRNNYVWMALNPSQGGGLLVFDKSTGKNIYLTDALGNGGLPSKAVRSLAVDHDGYVWVGSDAGIAYFIDTYSVFSGDVNAVKPIFDNRYLLKSEKVMAIKVDAANRKWVGTKNGVWLFNDTGEKQILNFTEDNSPLLSNVIQDIEINEVTGEVFFATDMGVVSYRGDATSGRSTFTEIKIFPNPITSNFNGTIGITGLATDATIKITDINGRLLWQTQAAGGTATWNGKDYHGNRAGTGVYVVFAASQDGVESAVGKIAVVE